MSVLQEFPKKYFYASTFSWVVYEAKCSGCDATGQLISNGIFFCFSITSKMNANICTKLTLHNMARCNLNKIENCIRNSRKCNLSKKLGNDFIWIHEKNLDKIWINWFFQLDQKIFYLDFIEILSRLKKNFSKSLNTWHHFSSQIFT